MVSNAHFVNADTRVRVSVCMYVHSVSLCVCVCVSYSHMLTIGEGQEGHDERVSECDELVVFELLLHYGGGKPLVAPQKYHVQSEGDRSRPKAELSQSRENGTIRLPLTRA